MSTAKSHIELHEELHKKNSERSKNQKNSDALKNKANAIKSEVQANIEGERQKVEESKSSDDKKFVTESKSYGKQIEYSAQSGLRGREEYSEASSDKQGNKIVCLDKEDDGTVSELIPLPKECDKKYTYYKEEHSTFVSRTYPNKKKPKNKLELNKEEENRISKIKQEVVNTLRNQKDESNKNREVVLNYVPKTKKTTKA